jgi:hypothetical protein
MRVPRPTVTWEVLTPEKDDPINLIRLKVTATQSDADGSEFIDRIEFGTLPTDWKLTTDGDLKTTNQPGTATEYVTLELPTPIGADLNFDFTATAFSQEKGLLPGDPDEASGSANQNIGIDFNHNQGTETFETNNQSIWNTGNAFSIDKNFFFGGEQPIDIDGLVDGHVKAGFTADLHLQGGDIDAKLPIDVTVDTTYNKTTDSLLIHTNAQLAAGGSFTTTGPEGNLALGFLIDAAIDAGIIGSGSVNQILPAIPPVSQPIQQHEHGLYRSGPVGIGHIGMAPLGGHERITDKQYHYGRRYQQRLHHACRGYRRYSDPAPLPDRTYPRPIDVSRARLSGRKPRFDLPAPRLRHHRHCQVAGGVRA